MTRALITMADAMAQIRQTDLDSNGEPPDAAYVSLQIEAASEAVLNYLKSGADAFLDTNGDVPVDTNGVPIVPFAVRAATLIMFGYLYRSRDEPWDGQEHGYPPRPVVSLLYQLRDPALA